MMDFEKESATMDMKEEMMSDAVDDAMDAEGEEEEEVEGDRILKEVLDEIGVSVGQMVRHISCSLLYSSFAIEVPSLPPFFEPNLTTFPFPFPFPFPSSPSHFLPYHPLLRFSSARLPLRSNNPSRTILSRTLEQPSQKEPTRLPLVLRDRHPLEEELLEVVVEEGVLRRMRCRLGWITSGGVLRRKERTNEAGGLPVRLIWVLWVWGAVWLGSFAFVCARRRIYGIVLD